MANFKKLLIMLLNMDMDNTQQLYTPFYQAVAAASLNYDVSMVITAEAGLILKKGVAEKIFIEESSHGPSARALYEFIRDAHNAGVKIFVCSPSLTQHQMTRDDLIHECTDIIGSATYIEMAMDEDTQVLTY